jgi:hypothetical protein
MSIIKIVLIFCAACCGGLAKVKLARAERTFGLLSAMAGVAFFILFIVVE